jgi:hypothetical protein
MLNKSLLGYLHVHLGAMFLQTQLSVLFKPPGGDLALTNAA